MAITDDLLQRMAHAVTVAKAEGSETASVLTADLDQLLLELADTNGATIQIGVSDNNLVGVDLGRFVRILMFKPEQAEDIGLGLAKTAHIIKSSPSAVQ